MVSDQDQAKPTKKNWQACSSCSERYLPAKMVERMQKKFPENAQLLGMCPGCRSKKAAQDLVLAKGKV